MYSMQRPGIAPDLVYTVNWAPNTLALFHNRGTLHSITGAFEKDEVRAFWQVRLSFPLLWPLLFRPLFSCSAVTDEFVLRLSQCNLAASDDVVGPSDEDVAKYV